MRPDKHSLFRRTALIVTLNVGVFFAGAVSHAQGAPSDPSCTVSKSIFCGSGAPKGTQVPRTPNYERYNGNRSQQVGPFTWNSVTSGASGLNQGLGPDWQAVGSIEATGSGYLYRAGDGTESFFMPDGSSSRKAYGDLRWIRVLAGKSGMPGGFELVSDRTNLASVSTFSYLVQGVQDSGKRYFLPTKVTSPEGKLSISYYAGTAIPRLFESLDGSQRVEFDPPNGTGESARIPSFTDSTPAGAIKYVLSYSKDGATNGLLYKVTVGNMWQQFSWEPNGNGKFLLTSTADHDGNKTAATYFQDGTVFSVLYSPAYYPNPPYRSVFQLSGGGGTQFAEIFLPNSYVKYSFAQVGAGAAPSDPIYGVSSVAEGPDPSRTLTVASFEYDSKGRLVANRDISGRGPTYTYTDSHPFPYEVRDALGNTSTTMRGSEAQGYAVIQVAEKNSAGKETSRTDVTLQSANSALPVRTVTSGNGLEVTRDVTYNDNGFPVDVVVRGSSETSYHDTLPVPVSERGPDGAVSYEWNADGSIAKVSDSSGSWVTQERSVEKTDGSVTTKTASSSGDRHQLWESYTGIKWIGSDGIQVDGGGGASPMISPQATSFNTYCSSVETCQYCLQSEAEYWCPTYQPTKNWPPNLNRCTLFASSCARCNNSAGFYGAGDGMGQSDPNSVAACSGFETTPPDGTPTAAPSATPKSSPVASPTANPGTPTAQPSSSPVASPTSGSGSPTVPPTSSALPTPLPTAGGGGGEPDPTPPPPNPTENPNSTATPDGTPSTTPTKGATVTVTVTVTVTATVSPTASGSATPCPTKSPGAVTDSSNGVAGGGIGDPCAK